VNLRPLFVVQFDRIMALSSGARTNFKITSGTSGNLEFIQPRVDPVERTVVFALGPGADPLQPNTEYRLIIEDSKRAADRLAAFDGAPFEGREVIRFTTGTDPTAQTSNDPQAVDACAAVRALQAKCSGAACHGFDPTGRTRGPTAPAMGLSLVSDDAIDKTAKNRAAVLVQLASEPGGTGEASTKFPYGLPLIAPGASSRSFLLYKILIDSRRKAPLSPSGAVAIPPPHPDLALENPPADPFVRMAAELHARVPGAPMPHDELAPEPGHPGYGPMLLDEVRILRRWIDDGARPCVGTMAGGDAGTDVGADGSVDGATDAAADGG